VNRAQIRDPATTQTRWEYGEIELFINGDNAHMTWKTAGEPISVAGGMIDGSNALFAALSHNLGFQKPQGLMSLMNLLGDQGWEYVQRREDRTIGIEIDILFKRAK
jgi:hypothetical protein